jgi:hypothetical protein
VFGELGIVLKLFHIALMAIPISSTHLDLENQPFLSVLRFMKVAEEPLVSAGCIVFSNSDLVGCLFRLLRKVDATETTIQITHRLHALRARPNPDKMAMARIDDVISRMHAFAVYIRTHQELETAFLKFAFATNEEAKAHESASSSFTSM